MDAQMIKDAQPLIPYFWEIMAFLSVIASLMITQVAKQQRWWPKWMCNLKKSKDGNREFKKLKKPYLVGMAMVMSWAGLSYFLLNRYPHPEEVMACSAVFSVLQWKLLDMFFNRMDKKNPELAEKLSHGIYVPEDATVWDKTIAYASGGGVDTRTNGRQKGKQDDS